VCATRSSGDRVIDARVLAHASSAGQPCQSPIANRQSPIATRHVRPSPKTLPSQDGIAVPFQDGIEVSLRQFSTNPSADPPDRGTRKRSRREAATFVQPPPDASNDVLDDLKAFVHEDATLLPLIQAALLHYQFETTHPFSRRDRPPRASAGCVPSCRSWQDPYSNRRPEMARLITSCWICSVPSKMSWITVGRLARVLSCRPVP
jgi:hypothetical protein